MNEYTYADLDIGHVESFCVNLKEEMVNMFREITGDVNPLHIDSSYAKSKKFQDKVVFGMLTSSFLSTLAGVYLPGKFALIQEVEIKFIKPVFVTENSSLRIEGTVVEKSDLFKLVILKINIFDEKGIKVCRGKMKVGVL